MKWIELSRNETALQLLCLNAKEGNLRHYSGEADEVYMVWELLTTCLTQKGVMARLPGGLTRHQPIRSRKNDHPQDTTTTRAHVLTKAELHFILYHTRTNTGREILRFCPCACPILSTSRLSLQ